MNVVNEFAPAKINLCLHVTGRRDDGYHLLDSVVAFADIGDDLKFRRASSTSLKIRGPHADALKGKSDNLVTRAAAALGDHAPPASIELVKRLPVAAGMGGGSADAASVLRGLPALGDRPPPKPDRLFSIALELGADVPACLLSRASRMRGIGEKVEPLTPLPALHAILVNPGVPVPTGPVFQALNLKRGVRASEGIGDLPDDGFESVDTLCSWLRERRNDLEPPALAMVPELKTVLASIEARPGCLLARMSGSGATCFGLFESEGHAVAAARDIARAGPDWWSVATRLG